MVQGVDPREAPVDAPGVQDPDQRLRSRGRDAARRHVAGEDLLRAGRYRPSYGLPAHFEVEVAQLMAGRWGYDVP